MRGKGKGGLLVLARHEGEEVLVGEGDEMVRVVVVGIKNDKVYLGFDGPRHQRIDRREVREQIEHDRLRLAQRNGDQS